MLRIFLRYLGKSRCSYAVVDSAGMCWLVAGTAISAINFNRYPLIQSQLTDKTVV
jgi:hypothetical protein